MGRFAFLAILLLVVATAHALSEAECLNMTKSALLEIKNNYSDPLLPPDFKNWNGTFSEKKLSSGTTVIIMGNMFIWCTSGLKDEHGNSASGYTSYFSDGNITIKLDRIQLGALSDYKSTMFHELIHAGVDRAVDKSNLPASLHSYSVNCEELLAHAKNLLLLQELMKTDEFKDKNLSKSFSYKNSMLALEAYIPACKSALELTDDDINRIMIAAGVKHDDQPAAKQAFKDHLKFVKDEIDKIKAGIMEKKITHMRSSGTLTSAKNQTLDGIRRWLNISADDYKRIYDEVAFADLPKRVDGLSVPVSGFGSDIAAEGGMLAVKTLPGDVLDINLTPQGGVLKVVPQAGSSNVVSVDEGALSGVLDSLDTLGAVKTALAEGRIMVGGRFWAPMAAYGQYLRIRYAISSYPFSPGNELGIGGEKVPLTLSPTGLTLAQMQSGYALILDEFGSVAGCTTSGAMRLAAYHPEQLTPSAGLYVPGWDAQTHRRMLDEGRPVQCDGSVHYPGEVAG